MTDSAPHQTAAPDLDAIVSQTQAAALRLLEPAALTALQRDLRAMKDAASDEPMRKTLAKAVQRIAAEKRRRKAATPDAAAASDAAPAAAKPARAAAAAPDKAEKKRVKQAEQAEKKRVKELEKAERQAARKAEKQAARKAEKQAGKQAGARPEGKLPAKAAQGAGKAKARKAE